MGRPHKPRQIEFPPIVSIFKPVQIPMTLIETVLLTVDEYEAVRLSDHQGLTHEEASEKMRVSRPTFTRIIESAHKKIAEAIVLGKALKIEGGKYKIEKNLCRCQDCGNYWEDEESKLICPECESKNVICLGNKYGRKCRHRHGKS